MGRYKPQLCHTAKPGPYSYLSFNLALAHISLPKCRLNAPWMLKTKLSSPHPMVPPLLSRTLLSASASTAPFFSKVRANASQLHLQGLIQFVDFNIIDSLAHFARERIPERVVSLYCFRFSFASLNTCDRSMPRARVLTGTSKSLTISPICLAPRSLLRWERRLQLLSVFRQSVASSVPPTVLVTHEVCSLYAANHDR